MKELRKKDAELEHQSRDVLRRYRAAKTTEEQAALKKQITTVVQEHFDVRQKSRNRQIKLLDEKLGKLKSQIEQREKERETLIGRRVSQLLGQDDELGF